MNLNCVSIQAALNNNEPLKLSGELAQHLSDCTVCAALLDARLGMKTRLQKALANDDAAPAALRARIRRELYQSQSFWDRIRLWFDGWNNTWTLATAATTVLVIVGVISLARWQTALKTSNLTAISSTTGNRPAALTEHNVELLKVGYSNHKHCAVERDYSAGPRSFAQMAEAMGDDWVDLVALTKEHVPADYRVMMAHHCEVNGRQFIHLILSNQQTLLSLVLTRKNGEAFDAQRAIAESTGNGLHQLREQDYSIAGFETATYLGYVVSGLEAKENLQLALRLAPAVKAFVMRRES